MWLVLQTRSPRLITHVLFLHVYLYHLFHSRYFGREWLVIRMNTNSTHEE